MTKKKTFFFKKKEKNMKKIDFLLVKLFYLAIFANFSFQKI